MESKKPLKTRGFFVNHTNANRTTSFMSSTGLKGCFLHIHPFHRHLLNRDH